MMKNSLPGNCCMLTLPKIADSRGDLTFIEGGKHISFEVKRVYYLYNMPENTERGGHAHRALKQLVIAMSGSFDVVLRDGVHSSTVTLNRPDVGLVIDNLVWRELKNFSSNATCVVLASDYYNESDYFRDYGDFLKEVNNR